MPIAQLAPAAPRRPAWRKALDLLHARGWTPSDLFAGIDALNSIDEACPSRTPHDVALCLLRAAADNAYLDGHGADESGWEKRVASLMQSHVETAALLTLAEEFWHVAPGEVRRAIERLQALRISVPTWRT